MTSESRLPNAPTPLACRQLVTADGFAKTGSLTTSVFIHPGMEDFPALLERSLLLTRLMLLVVDNLLFIQLLTLFLDTKVVVLNDCIWGE